MRINKNDVVWAFVNLARECRNTIVYGVPYYERDTGTLGLNTNALNHISNYTPLAYNICNDYPVYDVSSAYVGSFEAGRLRPKADFG